MGIIFVFFTSNHTVWNKKNLKSSGTQTEKTPPTKSKPML